MKKVALFSRRASECEAIQGLPQHGPSNNRARQRDVALHGDARRTPRARASRRVAKHRGESPTVAQKSMRNVRCHFISRLIPRITRSRREARRRAAHGAVARLRDDARDAVDIRAAFQIDARGLRIAIEFFLESDDIFFSRAPSVRVDARDDSMRIAQRVKSRRANQRTNRAFKASLTACGLALPPVVFITCPTNQPSMPGLAFACSALSGLAATTASTARSIAPTSVT